ncbi:uncharacterized protein LOC110044147 [Orbicella faveolata]|uniref:uncharacterized protein LOC110044147 n=1 Tax=Orbicella faveolata TaxID=48498 RepID=UPI0009E60664|nr:uncharacterized protein LOC110044147 [Orbicella faveolata]
MKSMLALLCLAAVAACAWAELEYHPQAVLHYLEMEDREMAKKVRSIVKARGLPSGKPTFSPSFKPSGFPTGIPLKVKFCLVGAIMCHKKAGDDACAHLECIKKTGKCLHEAGLRLHHLPDFVQKCLPIIPCCLLASETCEEKLCCFVRFGECAKTLGDKKDAE